MASSRKGEPDLPGRVLAQLSAQVLPGSRLSVGFSGGLDSSVLLHLLAELRPAGGYALSAVHVHHGLSYHADAWADHCRAVCATLAVPIEIRRVRVQAAGEGPEAAARAARYAAFATLDTEVLALAHHRDDQAETVLTQLLRGGGARGLAAMPAWRPLPGDRVRLWRPLLDTPRADLLAWARARGLAWVEDDSNRQTHLARNALRHDILPRLESQFPGAGATLAWAAGRFAEAASLLDDLADLDGGGAADAAGLSLARLAALPEPRARNLLRRYLEQSGATLHPDPLREALRQLLSARADARVRVAFGPVLLLRHGGRAVAVPAVRAVAAPMRQFLWRGELHLDLGGGESLVFQPVTGEGVRLEPGRATVRFRCGGEKLRLAPNRPRRLLKDLLREAAIPPWQRDRLPLLYVGDRLAWVDGIGADAGFRAGPGEPGWLISRGSTP
jgi:tRNA(Ile)-lysidine synthase